MNGMTIGKLSKAAGVTNDTVRFYERCGLINPVGRTESNYRLYREEDALRLRFIKRGKELGFSLNEIKDLLVITQDPNATKAEIKAQIDAKAENIRHKIRDLTKILASLEHLGDTCDGHGPVEECPILEFLTEDEDAKQQHCTHGGAS